MSKLGYTWYPKDWGNSEAVFELNLSERGLYRELIDMAMLNDNTTSINFRVWSRKFGSTELELNTILITLDELQLITLNEETIFINSCEARLNLVRGGKKGGKKSVKNKPVVKPIVKPLLSLDENIDKPTPNQRKVKEKETKLNIKETISNNTLWIESIAMLKRLDIEKVKLYLGTFLDDLELKDDLDKSEKDIKNHFVNWLNGETKKEAPKKDKPFKYEF